MLKFSLEKKNMYTATTNTVGMAAVEGSQARAQVTDGMRSREHVPGQGVEKAKESEGNPFLLRVPISGPWVATENGAKFEITA